MALASSSSGDFTDSKNSCKKNVPITKRMKNVGITIDRLVLIQAIVESFESILVGALLACPCGVCQRAELLGALAVAGE